MSVKQKLQFVAASSLLLVGVQAHAGPIYSDVLTVYGPQGNIYKQVYATEAEEESDLLFVINVAGLANPNQANHYTQVVDPDGKVGDIFGVGDFSDRDISGYCGDSNHFCLQFISTPEGVDLGSPITGDPNFLIVSEDVPGSPNVWDATMYLNQTLFPDYTATFSSGDIHIPEPTSLALVGLGGLAMSFARRASRKRS